MPTRFIFGSTYWRSSADQIRSMAEEMKDTQGHSILQRIADDYDELASRARASESREHSAEVINLKG